MSSDRTNSILSGTQKRIAREGDTAIRISIRTFKIILRAAGIKWSLDLVEDTHREVDAIALEALVTLALRNQEANRK